MNIIKKQEIFDTWRLEIDNRINNWKNNLLRNNQDLRTDYSIASLIELERNLIINYDISSLKNENHYQVLDACASYIGETIIRLLPDSKWHIYLDDVSNVDYGLPCVVTLYSGSISVHYLLREILSHKDGHVLKNRIEKILTYDKFIREQLRS